MKLVEPPSCSSASKIVFIGKNSRGNWVAQEQDGLYGGLFVNRAQAVKYVLFENGHHPETIVELAGEIELDRAASCPSRPPLNASSLDQLIARHFRRARWVSLIQCQSRRKPSIP